MPDKRLVYFTAQRVTAYRWRRGALAKEAQFDATEEGATAFTAYVAAHRQSLFYVLADVVEEDFFQENIPYVRGADRRALLERKLAQRYRDTSLALALPLGIETGQRREERILYTSFTNTQRFQPWLAALRSAGARLAGFWSAALVGQLVAPLLARHFGLRPRRYVLTSLPQAGLRQIFIENGRLRFSRLERVGSDEPRAAAEQVASETLRIQQYLVNMRMLPREEALEVVVLAPAGAGRFYEAVCTSSARIRFRILDLEEASRKAGLKSAPEGTLAEGLYLHLLARAPLPGIPGSRAGEQFADDALRRFYHLWLARTGLVAAGASVLAVCLVVSALNLWRTWDTERTARAERERQAIAARQYERTRASFPKTPVASDALKAVVRNYLAIERERTTPAAMLVEISHALDGMPQIELDRLDWRSALARSAAEAPGAAAATPAAATTPRASDSEPGAQTAEISGRLLLPSPADYRTIAEIVNRFALELRAQPGIEVISTRLPFDIDAEKSLTGDIGAQRSVEVPRFSMVIRRRATP